MPRRRARRCGRDDPAPRPKSPAVTDDPADLVDRSADATSPPGRPEWARGTRNYGALRRRGDLQSNAGMQGRRPLRRSTEGEEGDLMTGLGQRASLSLDPAVMVGGAPSQHPPP